MKPITLAGFAGANMAVHPRLLPESVCTQILDAEPGFTDLRPLKGRTTVATVPTTPQRLTLYRMGRDTPSDANYWLAWSTVVSAIRGFDGDDTTERTYFTGSGSPKWTDNVIGLAGGAPYPQGTRELAVPAPITQPLVTLNTDGASGTASTIFYVQTFVNDLGWESAPGPISTGLFIKPGAIVNIGPLEAAPAGSYGINRRRIYRTQAGADGDAEFYFLRELGIGTTTTQDDARALGDLMATSGWLPPPASGHSLIALWGGMTAMLDGRRILFSEPNAPYTYPARYDIPTLDKPLATAKWEQNLLVLTTGRPVLVVGTDPASMEDSQLAMSQPLAAVRSVVSFGHGVCWASNEGLAYAGTGGQVLLTEGVVTPAQWKAMEPGSMVAGRWGRFYVCSYTVGGVKRGFMVDPLRPALGLWSMSTGFDACWYDELADQLYVLDGGNVRKFAAGAALQAGATSKRFLQVAPCNYGFAKVVASSYPVTLTVTARWRDPSNGAEVSHVEARTVQNDQAFALSSGFAADDWQVEVAGVADSVQAARLATKPEDLKGI